MPSSKLVLAALGLLVLAACRGESADGMALPRSEELPGFTIAAPAGEPLREHRTDAAGELLFRNQGGVLAISWQAGQVSKADLPGFADTAVAALGTAVGGRGSGNTPMTLAEPDYGVEMSMPTDKKVVLVMSLVQCVRSNATVTLASMVSTDDTRARAFHARWTATLRCHTSGPTLSTDAGLPSFDLGDSIAYLPGSDPPSYYALDGRRWHVTLGVPALRKSFEQPEAVRAMFETLGLEVIRQVPVAAPGAPGWLQRELKFRVPGEGGGNTGNMLAGVLVCGDAAFSVMMFNPEAMMAPLPPRELERVSCPGKVATDPAALPTVPTLFGAACDGGDARACALLADLVGEEAALLRGLDAAALRKRACGLGRTSACPDPDADADADADTGPDAAP